jgi:hypothetical protein
MLVLARGACVNVTDCCDPSSVGILTRVSLLQHVDECIFAMDYA